MVGISQQDPSGGFIMRTRDGGENWESQLAGSPHYIFSIAAVDGNTAWAAGGEKTYQGNSGVILKTADGGSRWEETGPSDRNWVCIAACDGQNAMALGHYMYFSGVPPMFAPVCMKTSDGGSNWSYANMFYPVGMMAYPGGAFMFDPDDIWMVTGAAPTLGAIYRTESGGISWCTQLSAPLSMHDISAVDRDTAWAVGASGTIMHTTSGGYVGEEPVLASLSPETGKNGEVITLTGSGFGPPSYFDSFVTVGPIKAEIISWSDTQIVCKAPICGAPYWEAPVYVTTPGGTSDRLTFTYRNLFLSVESVYPTRGYQFIPAHNITVTGTGFLPGAKVRLVSGSRVINAINVNVVSEERIYCTLNLMGAAPGAYDVVVENADGTYAWLPRGFTVVSPCGQGGGTALLLLGASLGLLSLAGSRRLRRARPGK